MDLEIDYDQLQTAINFFGTEHDSTQEAHNENIENLTGNEDPLSDYHQQATTDLTTMLTECTSDFNDMKEQAQGIYNTFKEADT